MTAELPGTYISPEQLRIHWSSVRLRASSAFPAIA